MNRLEKALAYCDLLGRSIQEEVSNLQDTPDEEFSARLKGIADILQAQANLVHDEVRNLALDLEED